MDNMNIITLGTAISGSGTEELTGPISAVQSAFHGSASTVNQHSAGRVMVRTVQILTLSAAQPGLEAGLSIWARRDRAHLAVERDHGED